MIIIELLSASKDLADHPDDPKVMERYLIAQKNFQAASGYIQGVSQGVLSDNPSQKFILESGKYVASTIQDFLSISQQIANQNKDPKLKQEIEKTRILSEQFGTEITAFAPAILVPGVRKKVEESSKGIESSCNNICSTAKVLNNPNHPLTQASKLVSTAIEQLLVASHLAEITHNQPNFSDTAKELLDETARLMAARGNPGNKINFLIMIFISYKKSK